MIWTGNMLAIITHYVSGCFVSSGTFATRISAGQVYTASVYTNKTEKKQFVLTMVALWGGNRKRMGNFVSFFHTGITCSLEENGIYAWTSSWNCRKSVCCIKRMYLYCRYKYMNFSGTWTENKTLLIFFLSSQIATIFFPSLNPVWFNIVIRRMVCELGILWRKPYYSRWTLLINSTAVGCPLNSLILKTIRNWSFQFLSVINIYTFAMI